MSLIKSDKGAKDSNCYLTLEEAEAYFSVRLNTSEWDKALENIKEKALIMATSVIDTLDFSGKKWKEGAPDSDNYQALSWPRYPDYSDPYMLGIPHLMGSTRESREWVDSKSEPIIPKALKDAVCEQAYFLIRAVKGIDKREHLKGQGIKSISYPDINETFVDTAPIAPAAYRCLNKLNCLNSTIRIVRG